MIKIIKVFCLKTVKEDSLVNIDPPNKAFIYIIQEYNLNIQLNYLLKIHFKKT